MRRSTWLILVGLVIAVSPVFLAYLGHLLLKFYGRSEVSELLVWSFLLLIISIPIGAAMVVAGGVAKMVDRQASELVAALPAATAGAACPNCGAAVEWSAAECPKCRASFGAAAAWKPVAPEPQPASSIWLKLYFQAFVLFALVPPLLELVATYTVLPLMDVRMKEFSFVTFMLAALSPIGALVSATAGALAAYLAHRLAPAWFQGLSTFRAALWGTLLGIALSPAQLRLAATFPGNLQESTLMLVWVLPDIICMAFFAVYAVEALRPHTISG